MSITWYNKRMKPLKVNNWSDCKQEKKIQKKISEGFDIEYFSQSNFTFQFKTFTYDKISAYCAH